MQETAVRSLGREDPLDKEMATHFGILAWKIPRTEEPGWATVHGVTKSQTRLSDFTSQPYLGSAINGLKFWIKVYKEKFLLKKKYFKYYPNIWKVKAILAGIT